MEDIVDRALIYSLLYYYMVLYYCFAQDIDPRSE